jgi:hypothetical protein
MGCFACNGCGACSVAVVRVGGEVKTRECACMLFPFPLDVVHELG